jgi:HK97 family phage major capsid protein
MNELNPTEYGLKSDVPTVWRELSIKNIEIDQPKRSVLAYITTDRVDEEGEVVVPEGIDFSRFKKTGTVFYNHDYAAPCGVCTSIKHTDLGIMAVTQFPERPEGYEGKWLPDEVFAMFASDPPIVKAFSIGFAYTQVRQPTKKDFDRYGRDDIKRIVSKSRMLEYSVAPLPMNEDAIAVQVTKQLNDTGDVADVCNCSQASCENPESVNCRQAVGEAEQASATQPERSSIDSETKEKTMSEDIRKKMMVDLKPDMTIAELMAAMQMEDEADAVRAEVEEEVEKASVKTEDEKEEDKAAKSAVSLVADLVKKQAAEGRRRVAAATPVVTAPSYKGNLKHLKDAETAHGLGKFFLGAMGNKSAQQWVSDRYGIKAHGETNNSLGGFLVPDELEQAIIDLRAQFGKFRANTRVLNMSRDTLLINRIAGGLTAAFVGEGSSITEGDASFDQVSLVARKAATLTRYSRELAEDAVVNVGDFIAGEVARAFANAEDEAGFNGDGSSSNGGIVGLKNAVGSAGQKTGSGNAYSELTLADFTGTVGLAPEYVFSQGTPKWYMSTQFYHTVVLDLLADAGGNTNLTLAGGVAVPSLFGYEVVLADVLPKTEANSQLCAYFGALELGATMGDRRPTEIAVSEDRYFESDQIGVRGTTRFDINCHDVGDSSTAGAIVALKTAAS